MNNQTLPCKLREHSIYQGMYYLEWEDGTLSKDFYNWTWANEHLRYLPELNYKFNKRAD